MELKGVFFSLSSRRGNCKKAGLGLVCEVGLRCRTYYVLCGSVLSVWTKVEGVLASVSGTNVKMQIVRLRTEDGQRIVGKWLVCSFISILRWKGVVPNSVQSCLGGFSQRCLQEKWLLCWGRAEDTIESGFVIQTSVGVRLWALECLFSQFFLTADKIQTVSCQPAFETVRAPLLPFLAKNSP